MRRPHNILAALLAIATLPACSHKSEAPPPPSPDVSVVKLEAKPATVTEEYVATIEALNAAEIRPRVGGLLEKQVAVEGEHVHKGQVLFTIDPQPYIAALAQVRASLSQAKAAQEEAERELNRMRTLSTAGVASQQDMDAAVAKNDSARAAVEAAQANVKTAELNLGYTTLTSPIDGVIGRALLKVGGLVTAYSTLLTTVYSTDPMYVNFSVSEQRLLKFQHDIGRAPDQKSKTAPPFKILLADGSEYPLIAKLNFIDAAVDQRTGTLALRLEVPNPNQLLRAGQFARVRVPGQTQVDALVIPQRAVQEIQGKNFVWIVDDDGKAQTRDVTMGARIDSDWLVQSGLAAGDTVVVDGAQKLKPGTPVHATPLAAPPAADSATAVAPASTNAASPAAPKAGNGT